MKHERDFPRYLVCSDCDGTGRVERGRRGPNDPDVIELVCEECDGSGDVCVTAADHDDDGDE